MLELIGAITVFGLGFAAIWSHYHPVKVKAIKAVISSPETASSVDPSGTSKQEWDEIGFK